MKTAVSSTLENEKKVSYKKIKMRQYKQLYVMLLPAILFFVIFKYGPMFGVIIAFKNYRPQYGLTFLQSIIQSEWIGLGNFSEFFNSREGVQYIINTIVISALKLVFGFPMPIILALMLNEVRTKSFKRVIQTVSYLPHFISWVVLAGILRMLFSPDFGILVPLFEFIDVPSINFLGEARYFRGMLVVTSIWQQIGWGSIIYLAAISGIDEQLYEAAVIDGAKRFAQIIHITIPCIFPTIIVMFILRSGLIMRAGFDQVFNMLNPAVLKVGNIIDTYVYSIGLQRQQFSYATAVGLFQSVIGLILVITTNFLAKKLNQNSIW